MPDRSRRRALQTCAALVAGLTTGLGGCVSRTDSGGPDATTSTGTTESTTGTTESTAGRKETTDTTATTDDPPDEPLDFGDTVEVDNPGVGETGTVGVKAVDGRRQYYLGRLRAGGQRGIEGSPDRKYLWTAFDVSWSEQTGDCFVRGSDFARLVLDGDPYPIAEPCAYESDRADRSDGEAVFGVPAGVTADQGKIEWLTDGDPVAAWRIPDGAMAWSNDPPAFEVTSVEGPDRVRSGSYGDVAVEVRNRGGHDGVFRYVVDSSYSSGVQFESFSVPAGETKRHVTEATFADSSVTGDPPAGTVRVDWAYDSVLLEPTVYTRTTTSVGNESD